MLSSKVVGKRFPKVKNNGLQYLFLDAQFDEDDDDEVKAFEEAMEKLYGMIESHDGLPTNKINEEVCYFISTLFIFKLYLFQDVKLSQRHLLAAI